MRPVFAVMLLSLSIPGNPFLKLVQMTSDSLMRQVANAHSIFNIFNSFLFLPLIPLVARVCKMTVPVKESEFSRTEVMLEEKLNRLDERVKDYYSESLSKFGVADLTGLAILDFINYCERIGDHLTNVAQSLLGGGFWHGTDDNI